MNETLKISLKCLFCHQDLTYDSEKDQKFESGDLVKCSFCGESNDYNSVLEIAKNQGIKQVRENFEDNLKKIFGNKFKC